MFSFSSFPRSSPFHNTKSRSLFMHHIFMSTIFLSPGVFESRTRMGSFWVFYAIKKRRRAWTPGRFCEVAIHGNAYSLLSFLFSFVYFLFLFKFSYFFFALSIFSCFLYLSLKSPNLTKEIYFNFINKLPFNLRIKCSSIFTK